MTKTIFWTVAAFFCLTGASLIAGDWLAWRGPTGNGIAAPEEKPPVRWSETENVVWRATVPGRGHSSPIALGDLIVLTTADAEKQIQTALAYDRATGKERWRSDLHQGGFAKAIHGKNSHATPSPCSDGDRIFVVFHNGGRVHLTALDVAGKTLWTRDTGPYQCRYGYGYAPSPVVSGANVVVSSEFEKEGYLAAFDRVTGKERWRAPRGHGTNYATPALATLGGTPIFAASGDKRLAGYDPASGRLLWSTEAATMVTSGTPVWDGDLVFASGGYPTKETVAVRVTGTKAERVWKNGTQCYEQSMLAQGGHLFAIDDNGIAHCWRGADGEEKWKMRLGGPVSASPLLAGGNLYFTNERGICYVVKADPGKFELVAENHLGDDSFPSPVVSDNRLYLRVGETRGATRQEWLYCIGLGG